MADILYLSQLSNGKQNSVQLALNTLVLLSVKVGGSGSNTELTKAILDNLVLLQNGSDAGSLHIHDARYFTQTQLGATSVPSGASRIGVNLTATNYTAGSQSVEAHLAGINTALGSVSINNFNDSLFNVFNNTDNTKKIKFLASAITTGQIRTITMADFDVNLAALTNANIASGAAIAYSKLALTGQILAADIAVAAGIPYSKLTLTASVVNADIASAAAINLSKLAAVTASRALQSDGSGVITTSSVTTTELGYLSGVTSAVQSQLDNLTSIINGYEWQASVLSATLLTPPGSPSTGDRYLINGTGAGGWAGHNNVIAQWNGTVWVYTTPTTGTFVGSDAEPSVLYLFGGTTWSSKSFEASTASTGLTKVGVDIQLASSVAGNGLTFTSGVLSVNVDSQTTQITGGNVAVKLDAAGAIVSSGSGIAVQLESSNPTLSIAANRLGAKLDAARGITTGASGIGVNIDTGTMVITTNAVGVKNAGISANQLASGAFDQSTITGGAGVAAVVNSSPRVTRTLTAGEAFAAQTTYAVRWGMPDLGETAGRVYKADPDTSVDDKFHVVGLVLPQAGSITAGQTFLVRMMGGLTLGTSDVAFTSTQQGRALYLASGGLVSATSPTATGTAVVRVGMAQDSATIQIGPISVVGVN